MDKREKIAVDLGYGDTKVCTEKGCFKFPSAVEWLGESVSDFGGGEDDIFLFNGKEYRVGEKAAKPVSTRSFGFLVNYAPLLVYAAIKRAGIDPDRPVDLVVGLSIANWGDRDKFLKSIETICIDNVILRPQITLMAQGQGVFIDYEGDKEGLVCVCDIGFNTFDFLVFDNKTPDKKLSFATDQGANMIITRIQSVIQKRYNHPISEQEAKTIFVDGGFRNFGDWVDLGDMIRELKSEYSKFILSELRSRRNDTLRRADKVIFSGGGAWFLADTDLPGNVVFSGKPYEFANVRGYYRG